MQSVKRVEPMSTFIKHASIASLITLTVFGTAGLVRADSIEYESSRESEYNDGRCYEDTDECGYKQSRRQHDDEDDHDAKQRYHDGDNEISVNVTVTESGRDWKFDSDKHRRRHHKDAEYRFYNSGYWYPQPYWQGYAVVSNDRLSCRDGREAVRDRGFYRVKPIDCRGRTFTYLAHRRGETFKILVSARSGRIVDVDPI